MPSRELPLDRCDQEEAVSGLPPCRAEQLGTRGAAPPQRELLATLSSSSPTHLPLVLQQFLLSELGTSGSLDGTQRLIVKGRFLPKAFETVLRR